jgi:hypothetical protein
LQVEYFLNLGPRKDMMIPSNSLCKSEAFQHLTKIAKPDIRIALTAEHPFECLIFGHAMLISVRLAIPRGEKP